MSGVLLIAGEHMVDGGVPEGVIEGAEGGAGVPKYHPDPLRHQSLDDRLRAVHQSRSPFLFCGFVPIILRFFLRVNAILHPPASPFFFFPAAPSGEGRGGGHLISLRREFQSFRPDAANEEFPWREPPTA